MASLLAMMSQYRSSWFGQVGHPALQEERHGHPGVPLYTVFISDTPAKSHKAASTYLWRYRPWLVHSGAPLYISSMISLHKTNKAASTYSWRYRPRLILAGLPVAEPVAGSVMSIERMRGEDLG